MSDAQRAEHHARREAILVRRGEVNGKPGPAKGDADKLSATPSYARKAAADLGVDERTIRRDLRRGKNIEPAVLGEVAGTDLDKGVVLDELAATPKPEQRAKLAEIVSWILRRTRAPQASRFQSISQVPPRAIIAFTMCLGTSFLLDCWK